MNYLAIFFTILLFSFQTICFKFFNLTYMKNLASYFIFNFLYFSVAVFCFLIIGGVPEDVETYTFIFGISFGVLFTLTIFSYMKAMETGPMSYASLFFSFGLIVPIIFGIFFWNEKISIMQIFSMILLLVTFYLCGGTSSNTKRGMNLKWVFFCVAALIGNGGLMTLAKEHQILLVGRQINEFLIISFGTAAILSLLVFSGCHLKRQSISHVRRMSFLFIVLGAGATTAIGNQLTLYLSSRIPSILQFPAVNGGVVVLSTVASTLVFKDRLTLKGKVGLVIGIMALVLLNL